jgi:hypothetical protein
MTTTGGYHHHRQFIIITLGLWSTVALSCTGKGPQDGGTGVYVPDPTAGDAETSAAESGGAESTSTSTSSTSGGGDGVSTTSGGGESSGSETGVAGCSDATVDENGVAYLPIPGFGYEEGGVERFDWQENFKDNGSMRHDFEGAQEENQCLVGYFLVDGPDGEEISAKLGGGPHSSDNSDWADTHDVAITNFSGDRSRIRWEADHPSYDDGPTFDIEVGDVRGKWVGAAACKLNFDEDGDGEFDHIWYLAWVDPEGLDESDKPNNAWVSTMDTKVPIEDVELKSPTIPYVVTIDEGEEAQATIRVDEQDEGSYEYMHIAYRSPVQFAGK